ncbi:hypothetical protein K438DRAFT_1955000 [Mycena galopus ATCC 62051]|nr:hypothetical protein K438DRAFT_1955000 [Mycena galopus ATCC 62051]
MASTSETEVANTLLFLRFFTAFGLASLVYDHCLTLGMEVKFIWLNSKTGWASKAAFGINRYLTEAIIAYTVYTAIIFGAVTHSIVVLRIYSLWDQRANVARALIFTFFICIIATLAIGIFCELELQPLFQFSEFFGTCVLTSSSMPRLVSVAFAIQTFFDVLILVIAVYNALERPHRTTGEVINSLAKDGFKFLLATFWLRSLYLVTSLVGNPGECFATVATCWSFTSIISARLHLRLDGLALKGNDNSDLPLPISVQLSDSSWYDY